MDITPRHRSAETRFRHLVDDAGLDPPDAVEYDADSLTFFWNGPKVAVIVDLDDAVTPIVASCAEP
jgi:hypothetical protein